MTATTDRPASETPTVILPGVTITARPLIERTRKGRAVIHTLQASYSPYSGLLHLEEIDAKGRATAAGSYDVAEVPTNWGRAWRLEPVAGTNSDPEGASYHVLLATDGTSCDCKHACSERGGWCKHVTALKALYDLRAFDPHPLERPAGVDGPATLGPWDADYVWAPSPAPVADLDSPTDAEILDGLLGDPVPDAVVPPDADGWDAAAAAWDAGAGARALADWQALADKGLLDPDAEPPVLVPAGDEIPF